ncbi:hypothetical protein FH972_026468 [Carpinus fangiana]|uniref:Uncharacterized protein n=1 Tax=Carpinus fangiana TaxID=176857 RepID=A0A5N6L428_9ROSI|nr:hypothetical protein FH972_026468 [Carpinus fangiana]
MPRTVNVLVMLAMRNIVLSSTTLTPSFAALLAGEVYAMDHSESVEDVTSTAKDTFSYFFC